MALIFFIEKIQFQIEVKKIISHFLFLITSYIEMIESTLHIVTLIRLVECKIYY